MKYTMEEGERDLGYSYFTPDEGRCGHFHSMYSRKELNKHTPHHISSGNSSHCKGITRNDDDFEWVYEYT